MITVVDNPYKLGALKAFIGAHNEFSFDVETSGLNVRSDKVIGFCIATSEQSYYLPIGAWDIPSKQILFNTVARDWAVEVLQLLQSKRLITWNGAFDLPITCNDLGVDLLPNLYIDATLLFHSCNEEGVFFSHKPFALKTAAAFYLGGESVVEAKDLAVSIRANGGTKGQVSLGDPELVAKYGAKDGLLTMRLKDIFEADAKKQGVWQHFLEEKMTLYREVTIPMEQTGLRLDLPLLEQTQKDIALDLANIEFGIQGQIAPLLPQVFIGWFLNKDYPPARSGAFAQGIAEYYQLPLPRTKGGAYSMTAKAIAELPESLAKQVLLENAYLPAEDIVKIQQLLYKADAGDTPMFNIQSGYHLKKLFFDTLKEQPLSRTPTGLPQCNDDFLDSMVTKYPWARQLQLHRRLSKLKGTYIDRFLEEQENGRFYPSFFQHRTVSNRYGSDIQQMPRKLELGSDDTLVIKYTNLIRDFIIADEGCILIGADYESLEPHVFAHVSGDEKVKNIFRSGHDFYSTICIGAEKLEGFSSDKQAANYLGAVRAELRQRAKAYALGIAYGETAYKIQFELGITIEQAQFIVDGYWTGFPQLKQSVDASHLEVLRQGYVTIESGFRRHMPRARTLYQQYGEVIKDDLKLWKKYHEDEIMYAKAKRDRKEFKNYLNNSFNVKIQGLSASIVNRGAIAANRAFKALNNPWPCLMQIHDELVTQAPLAMAEQIKAALKASMENAYTISVPLRAVPNMGQRYGDLK